MTKLRSFERRLITLRRREDVHPFFIRQLGQALRVHWAATLLLGFQRLSGIAGIDYQQQMAGVETFNCSLQLNVRNAVLEYRLQAGFGQLRAFARVAKVMRNEIKALRLSSAVAGKVDDYRVFRLGAL